MPIKGLIFDAYGTLYGVHSVTKTSMAGPKSGYCVSGFSRFEEIRR
jgi:FMN phosphatase YigB (HAD superfamily)